MNQGLLLVSLALAATVSFAGSDKISASNVIFKSIDSNSDGFISAAEADPYEKLAADFRNLDKNSDSQLSSREFGAFPGAEG